jgi:TM2 domain-containing membrane protein YozV
MDYPDPLISEEQPPALPPPAQAPRPKVQKAPGLALVLAAIFPGIGQVYNGQPAKALVFFSGFVGSLWACIEYGPMPFAFMIPFAYFYGIVDAYRSAVLLNARGEGALPEEDVIESPAWGAGLVLIGIVLLANNLGWLNLAALRDFWPLILVIAGVVLLYGSFQKRKGTGNGPRL